MEIPENRSLQFSTLQGDIGHQGILASNITGTPFLSSTFPTTSTGTSLGHYHYTEPVTNALQFLNVAGSGSGGHKFYTSNSTSAPVNTATIGLDGLTIETTTAGPSTLLPLPNVQNSIDIAVIMSSPVNVPPYNMGPVNTFWPVQVNSVCTNMVPGVTYYAKYFNGTTLQMNSVFNGGDGTIINAADLASRPQPILSLVTGTSTISQTVNLFENLTITNDTDTSALTATALTFNNVNVKMNQVTPTLIYSSPLIYADGHEPATSNSIKNTYGYTGWYYRNSAPNVAPTNKINWYFPPQTPTATPVSALKGISISFFNGITTSNDDTLFITIYTVPTGTNDYAPGFFHSANTYVFNQSITPVAHTNYQGVCIIDKSLVPFNYETQIQFEQSTVNNPKGTFAQTDNILSVVIGTNSASATGDVQLVVNKLNLHYYDFTQSYLLVPP